MLWTEGGSIIQINISYYVGKLNEMDLFLYLGDQVAAGEEIVKEETQRVFR